MHIRLLRWAISKLIVYGQFRLSLRIKKFFDSPFFDFCSEKVSNNALVNERMSGAIACVPVRCWLSS